MNDMVCIPHFSAAQSKKAADDNDAGEKPEKLNEVR
jgi:hypothetical protein